MLLFPWDLSSPAGGILPVAVVAVEPVEDDGALRAAKLAAVGALAAVSAALIDIPILNWIYFIVLDLHKKAMY